MHQPLSAAMGRKHHPHILGSDEFAGRVLKLTARLHKTIEQLVTADVPRLPGTVD